MSQHPLLKTISEPAFEAQFVGHPAALYRQLSGSPLIQELRYHYAVIGSLTEQELREFADNITAKLCRGVVLEHDLALAAVAVVLDGVNSQFAKEFVCDLGRLQCAEMGTSTRVARECYHFKQQSQESGSIPNLPVWRASSPQLNPPLPMSQIEQTPYVTLDRAWARAECYLKRFELQNHEVSTLIWGDQWLTWRDSGLYLESGPERKPIRSCSLADQSRAAHRLAQLFAAAIHAVRRPDKVIAEAVATIDKAIDESEQAAGRLVVTVGEGYAHTGGLSPYPIVGAGWWRGQPPEKTEPVVNEFGDRLEGFWRVLRTGGEGDDFNNLPWPEPNAEPAPWQADFLSILKRVEDGSVVQRIGLRGFSECRLCKRPNGSIEYHLGGWRWPDGLKHYIAEHNVRPSADFVAFITHQFNLQECRPLQEGRS